LGYTFQELPWGDPLEFIRSVWYMVVVVVVVM